ncbi:MAG: hypothetical protein WA177_00265 [Xanthobacteraceae bacterium]
MPKRRFLASWSVEESPTCFIVKDGGGDTLAYVYFEEDADRAAAAKMLTKDAARRIAVNFAELPELLRRRPIIIRNLRRD